MENAVKLDLVSTIIPVYNRARMLRRAVSSVLAQTYRPVEVVLVDDGSTDDTPDVADALADEHAGIVRVLHTANGGPGSAREAGRRVATGEFIQYLDSDDVLLPRKFEMQVAALRARPECGAAYGITRLIDEQGIVLASPYKWTGRTFDALFPALLIDRWWNTHTPLWRRAVCDAIGPWASMRMSEDYEYDARAGALGVRLVHCPEELSDTTCHEGGRLTGGAMDADMLRDIARLIVALHEGAKAADVPVESPEMRHFSRWAFLVARQAATAGLVEQARACFEIARDSATPDRARGRDFRLFRLATRVLGWRLAGWLTGLMRRGGGEDTLKQSWMAS